jgi:superfamily II DNA or RNA helicase
METNSINPDEFENFQRWHFDHGGALKLLQELLGLQPNLMRISSAYFDIGALKYVLDKTKTPVHMRLLIGFRDIQRAEESVKPVLEQINKVVKNGLADEVLPAATIIYDAIVGHQCLVREFQAKYRYNLHAKAYYADTRAMVLGSPNFSRAGLEHNVEGSIYIDDPSALAYYIEQFDYYFSKSRDITIEVKEILEEQLYQEPLSPYEFYLLCLHHFYPKLKNDRSSTAFKKYYLSEYQSHMVIMACRMLDEQRRVMLVSPTGTGKTIMGCRIAYELRELGKINRVLVISPASLVDKWKAHLLDFHLSPDVYSMEIVGHSNSFKKNNLIYKLLESVDDKTLLIIDESQHFRNYRRRGKNKGTVGRVMQLLKVQSRPDRPYSLALTATPYSTKWEDFETQLKVIGKDSNINDIEDLKSQPILHITLPFIIQQYAKKDEWGSYLDFGGNKWRFSNIDVRSKIIFEYPHAEIISELECLVFEFERKQALQKLPLFDVLEDDDEENSEMSDDLDILDNEIVGHQNRTSVWRTRMVAITLLKFALSSFSAFLPVVETYLSRLDDYDLVNREEVRQRLTKIKQSAEIAALEGDNKAARLVELLKIIPASEKVLIFCEARPTVEYLSGIVVKIRPDAKTIIGGMTFKEKLKLVSCFAPLANSKFDWEANEKETNTLIATDCISEGLDFQDANYLINYDLPWTPLTLVQRLGRLDRPTDNQRNFVVYNFAPPTDVSKIILNFMDTLTERADIYRTMAKINLLEEDKRTAITLLDNDPGFVKLFLGSDISYTDYAKIRDKLVPIPVTSKLADLAKLTIEKRIEFDKIPTRARSAMKARLKDGYFILFSCRGDTHILLVNSKGEIYPESYFQEQTMLINQISCHSEELLLPIPQDINIVISLALRKWAESKQIEPDEITEIGACALIS